jgi:hypothetical protein
MMTVNSGDVFVTDGYEAFVRCGSLYAGIDISLGVSSGISRSTVYDLLKTAAEKLRITSNG